MKSSIQFAVVAVVATFAILFHGGSVHATAPAPVAVDTPGDSGDAAYHACLRACLEQYQSDLERCQDACTVCDWRFLGMCFSSSTSDSCLAACRGAAQFVWEACKAACLQD